MNRIFYMAMLLVTWLSFAPSYADDVAQIGSTTYATLAEAIADVPADGTPTTITMLGDHVLASGVTVAKNQSIVIDLAGHTVSGTVATKTDHAYLFTNKGTLVITDSSQGGTGGITYVNTTPDTNYSKETCTIYNAGNLTLTKGTVANTTLGGASYAVTTSSNAWGVGDDKETVFNMNGGTLTCPSGDQALRVYQNSADTTTPFSHNTVTISGGRILDTGIFLDNYIYQPKVNTTGEGISTNVTISGGEIHGLIDMKLRHTFHTSLAITGGTFVDSKFRVRKAAGEWASETPEPTSPVFTISGGQFSFASGNDDKFSLDRGSGTTWTSYEQPYLVSGGVFSQDLSTCSGVAYPAGKEVVANTDANTMEAYPWTVGSAAVAQIGETKYASLADAIAAVPTNGTQKTITMLTDETLEKEGKLTVSAGMNIVLDLNGKTVSSSSDANAFYFFTNNGTLEITDNSQDAEGKISFQSSKTDYANERVTIYNLGGTLTLTKGLVENTTAGGMAYAVVNSSNAWANDVISTFNVAGGRVSAPKGDAALRVYQNTSANAVQSKNYVNISGGTIDAAGIFVDTYLYTKDKDLTNYTGSNVDTKINVTGGTVNGLIDMKIRHPFNTLLNISGGDFSNTRIWVRKYASEYEETFGEPTAPMVTISNGTFDFIGENSFGLAYDYAATSWTSYAKPYEISGGVYDLSVPAEYCADGYAPADSGDGTFTVRKAAVAQIGETKYASLAEAIAAVPTDGTQTTITMLADEAIAAGLTVAANQNIVLELAGHVVSEALSQSGTSALITNKGTLVIQDNTDTNKDGTGTGKISYQNATPDQSSVPGYASNTIINNGNLTIESGYVENTTSGGYAAYTVDNITNGGLFTPVFTMNGGKLYNSYTDAVRMFLNSTTNLNKVVINGGVLDSDKASGRVVVMHMPSAALGKGELDITGGTINGKVNAWSAANDGGVEDRFSDAQYENVSINITGGNIDEISFTEMANTELRANSLIVTGGTYKVSPAVYVTSGYEAVENGDGTFTVQRAAVAQIGETKYASLADAIAAVPTDGTQTTITMLGDEVINVSGSALTIANNKNVVLELNGHQVVGSCSSGSSSALITNRGTLTIQDNTDTNCDGTGTGKMISGADPIWIHDGSDNYSGSYASNLVTNQGTLVIKSGYFENVSHGSATYAVDNQTSSKDVVLNVEGGKLTAVSCVVRMFCNSTTKQNVVNVSGGHIVTSGSTGIWTQLPQSSSSIKPLATLNVTGGEISGRNRAWYDYSFGASFESVNYSISGGEFNGELLCNAYKNGIIGGFITGGTFSVDPSEYVAAGYAAALVEAENVWKVGPVTVTDLTPQEGATETTAEYKATTVVTDENNEQHVVETNQTVSVAVVEENNVGEDVKLSDFKMNEVVTKAVVAANTEDDIDVQLIVKAAEPVVSDETVTFEVHPEAIITVNNGEPTNVMLTNDDLAQDATFTFVLDVTGRFSNGAAIKVVHKSEGYEDETFYSTVIDGKVTVSGITHFSDFELSVVGAVAQIGETEYASLADAFAAVEDGQTIKMLIDVVLPSPLNVQLADKSVTLNLDTHTLTGRTNLKSGSLHIEYGHVVGGSEQALNVYGSSDPTAVDYSWLTIGDYVDVTADNYAICLFGATATSNGYGARVDIDGINATVSSVNDGTVFVSGNLGNGISGDQHNVVNINGTVTSTNNAAVALHGNATVNVLTYASITGHTGIAVKRGTLNVAGGTIVGNGEKNTTPAPNGNGTELTGAGISVSPTYSNYGPISVNISRGEANEPARVQSVHADALFKQEGNYVNDATIAVSGGIFSSEVPEEFCAEGYRPIDHGNGIYSVTEIEYEAQLKHGETYVNYASLQDALAAAADGDEVYMMRDVTLSEPLNVELAGKAVTLDLGANTLTGRTNLKSGNLTLTNGYVAGGSKQALNVYGSSDPTATNYSVLTINSNVVVTADVYGVCLFGATATTNGYGAVVNINGRVVTGGDGKNGAVFVSGNLGNNVSGDMHNVVNITGEVTSYTDAGVALNGNATVNVLEGASVMGATGIAVKRGTLNMTGGIIYADGEENTTPSVNNNGTEMTGAGISMSPTYSQYGPMSVVITGGEVQSDNAVALFKQTGTYQSDATFSVSGGLFSSEVPAEFCADGYQPKYDQASGKYTVATFAAIWADRDIELIDGQSYEACVGEPVTQDVEVRSVTYQRYVPNANTYCAWYVPAAYRLTSADLDQFNFYRINLIANAEGGNEVQNTTRIWVYLFPMAADDVLTANRPYVFKTKGGTGEFIFTLENTLHAPATDVRLNNSTTAHNYDFYGTYETTELSDNSSEHFFYVDYYGQMGWPGSYNINVGPYRWYIKTTQKGGGAYYAPTFVFTDDPNVTGITDNLEVKTIDCYYDLKGMKIEKPSKGAYLVKFKDGTVKKVVK